MLKNMLDKIFIKTSKNESKNLDINDNPFTKIDIYDRRIDKFNYCITCRNTFKNNIDVELYTSNGDPIHKITCTKCNRVYYFRNWNDDKSKEV